jgi:hypothetical protein
VKEFPGQTSTGFKTDTQKNPSQKTQGRGDGTDGGQHATGHLTGTGAGGIKRGGGPNPVVETQGKTGFEQKTARATKDSGGHPVERVDKVSEV